MRKATKLVSPLQLAPRVKQHAELQLGAFGATISPLSSVGWVGTRPHPGHALLSQSDNEHQANVSQHMDMVSLLACPPKGSMPAFMMTHHDLVFTQLLRASDPWATHQRRSITFMRFLSVSSERVVISHAGRMALHAAVMLHALGLPCARATSAHPRTTFRACMWLSVVFVKHQLCGLMANCQGPSVEPASRPGVLCLRVPHSFVHPPSSTVLTL